MPLTRDAWSPSGVPRSARLAAVVLSAALISGCGGGNPPPPANSNPFGDVTAGDPAGAARPPVVRVPARQAENADGNDPAGPSAPDFGTSGPAESIATVDPRPVNARLQPAAVTANPSRFGNGDDLAGSSSASQSLDGDSNDSDATADTGSTDWAQFRGPGGSGIAPFDNIPVTWTNASWKEFIPGRGASSPIVVGDRVIITYYAGYGVGEQKGNPRELQRWIASYDRYTGVKQWEQMVPPTPQGLRVAPYRGDSIAQHGYASGTPVSDGNRIYAPFDTAGVFALSPDGRFPGVGNLGKNTHKWGSGSSPILYKDLLIANAAVESGALGALRASTGQLVWQIPGLDETWATPVLIELPGGRPEVVLPVKGKIISVDAQTGIRLWYCDWVDDYVVPSVVAADGIIYAIGGRSGKSIAVRAGGRGDVTRSHVIWTRDVGANVPSPVVYEGHLYWVSEDGIACCLDADTGEILTQRRVDTGEVYASPVVAGGKLYVVSRRNGIFVFEADPEMELVAHNTMPGDDSVFNASPAVADGQLFLRSDRYLYCISQY